MNNHRSKAIKYYQFNAGQWEIRETRIILERIVSLIVDGKTWMEMLCTPHQLDCLAVGFLYNEGYIQSAADLVHVQVCDTGEYVEVKTTLNLEKPKQWLKTTGCSGGVTSLNLPALPIPHLQDIHLTADELCHHLQAFVKAQQEYLETRGVHTSAISDGKKMLILSDDIGRHNTLDKLAGYCILNQIPFPQPLIFSTGRISSEMLQKSARIGSSLVISLTSPNDYSIELAEHWGITLVGYARGNSFNLYTRPERIIKV
jgi:FdhD protein